MFPQLSDKLQEIFKELRGHGSISESNIDAALIFARAHYANGPAARLA
jgi:signal recognition particle GTPase